MWVKSNQRNMQEDGRSKTLSLSSFFTDCPSFTRTCSAPGSIRRAKGVPVIAYVVRYGCCLIIRVLEEDKHLCGWHTGCLECKNEDYSSRHTMLACVSLTRKDNDA